MYKDFKRISDIIFSAITLLLLLPVFIPIIILLKLTGEGEIFYRQERLGFQNRTFGILKFATMLKNSASMGSGLVTVRKDPRITPLGGFLRRYKINELPQLWNVFSGEMSFVGPRPLPESSVAKYNDGVKKILYKNRPGITGIGSLIFRDEEKLVTCWKNAGGEPLDYYRTYIYPYKGMLEKWYYDNISFITDLKLLFLTAWSLFDSHSKLPYRFFSNLPAKPVELSEKWIISSYEMKQ
jgi:lipopolysaccharide/colanic/teichoic acid biosynthesis glycosyltransferase